MHFIDPYARAPALHMKFPVRFGNTKSDFLTDNMNALLHQMDGVRSGIFDREVPMAVTTLRRYVHHAIPEKMGLRDLGIDDLLPLGPFATIRDLVCGGYTSPR